MPRQRDDKSSGIDKLTKPSGFGSNCSPHSAFGRFDPLLFEFISDIIWTMNPQLRLTFVSPSIYNLLGYTPQEALQLDLSHLVAPDSYEKVLKEYENEKKRKTIDGFPLHTVRTLEFQLLHKNGSAVPCEIKLTLIRNVDGSISEIVGVTRSLVERRELESARRDFRNKLERIFQSVPVMLMALDKQGKVVAWNRACAEVTGFEADEIIGNNAALELLFPDSDYRRKLLLTPDDGDSRLHPTLSNIARKDGSTRIIEWWNISGSYPIPDWHVWVVGIDATERIKAEQNLKQSEERLRSHYMAFPVPTYTWQKKEDDFYLIDFNDAALKITDGNIPRYLGISMSQLYRNSPEIMGDMWQCYHEKTTIKREMEYRYQSTGKTKYLDVTYVYIPNDMVVVYTDDITERKRGEHIIKESESRYNMLFNSVLEGLGVVDNNETITFCNPAFAAIFEEISPGSMVGKSLANYLDSDQFEIIKQQTAIRRNGESSQYELSINTAKGNKKTILVSASPRQAPDGSYIGAFGAILDITEHVKNRIIGQSRLNLLNNLRQAKTVDECLALGCQTIREAGLFARAVMTFHNDRREIINIGYVGLDEDLILRAKNAPAPDPELSKKMTDPKFRMSRSYFIPKEAGIDYKTSGRFVPQSELPAKDHSSWRAGDELFVPISDDDGRLIGWLSVDSPFDGMRPTLETVLLLEEIIDIVCKKTNDIISQEKLNQERKNLIETNIALKEVLSFIEREKKEIKNQISAHIDQIILPALKKMINEDGSINKTYYKLLNEQLEELASSAGGAGRIYSKLTPRQMEICSLIKSGYTSKEIARSLSLSLGTVSKHREIIRKKLGLANSNTNLIQFLKNG